MDSRESTRVRSWRRQKRVRRKIFGTPDRPRLSVFRSHKHIYAQLIDDLAGKTVCSASSRNQELRQQLRNGGDLKAAEIVGTSLGQRAVMRGIKTVVFDRGPYKFHGRVKALAEAARKTGLEF